MLAMPRNFCRCLAVEAQEKTCGVSKGDPVILPHHARHVISATELIGKALTVNIKQHTTHSAECLGSKKLDLGIRLLGMNEASWMNLDPFQINCVCTHSHGHLEAIPGAVVTVGCWQMHKVRPVLCEQGICGEVGAKASRADDHWPILLADCSVSCGALHTADIASRIGEQFLNLGLQHNLCAASLLIIGNLLKCFHERICDSHAWEALLTTMCPWVGVTTKPGHEAQVEAKLINKPINRWRALLTKHSHKVWALGSTTHAILSKGLGAVCDLQLTLRLCQCSIDTTCCFRAVATEKR
mmetsp:Transcript_30036/g.53035  ORF Transcript_30036/g.53035 Transcript_30036/m.53035 type:complete len:298 (-) Transcript_30036:218-1111(-)